MLITVLGLVIGSIIRLRAIVMWKNREKNAIRERAIVTGLKLPFLQRYLRFSSI